MKFGVRPDLTTLGKIIGGGLPIGAFCGRREIMQQVAPQGPVYQAGTFSGNPLSLAAGIATVRWLHDHPGIYPDLAEKARAIGESIGGGTWRVICPDRLDVQVLLQGRGTAELHRG